MPFAYLDLAIAMCFIFLLLALICTTINETIAGIINSRGKTLEKGVAELLQDGGLKDSFYAHPLITSQQNKAGRLPSYISSNKFALALMDILTGSALANYHGALLQGVAQLNNSATKTVLTAVLHNPKFATDQERLEAWFEQGMNRVSGWYKRTAQVRVFVLAVLVTLLMNADALRILQTLRNNPFSRECKPHFLGVWDTVSSVGWVYNVAHFPGTKATHNPDLSVVRHAVSIDERRAFFRQNLFGDPHDSRQDVKEIWFAGVHSDVGGSYPESESQLSKIALRWMVLEAEVAGLRVDQKRKADILGANPPYVSPDPLTTNQHESLRGAWWVAELWPKIAHVQTAPSVWKKQFRLNLGRRRWIAPDQFIHSSVQQRLNDKSIGYDPSNLPSQHRVVGDTEVTALRTDVSTI